MFSEGIIDDVDDVLSIGYCVDPVMSIDIIPCVFNFDGGGLNERLGTSQRSTSVSSAWPCGRIDALELLASFSNRPVYSVPPLDLVKCLPARLREKQSIFDETGGIHGAPRG